MSRGPSASNSDSYLTTSQPHASAVSNEFQGWMNTPQKKVKCPPGLEYLTTIDQLLVQQEVESLEAWTGFETKNKFAVKNSSGQKVYYAVEKSGALTRVCCGKNRPFEIIVLDKYKNTVIHLHHPLPSIASGLHSIVVSAPPGTIVGTVEQQWSLLSPTFVIKNPSGETCLKIKGTSPSLSMGGDVKFKIMSADGNTQIGKISKQWSGLAREMFTDADNFGITFPVDLAVRMKAVVLGACFLIDAAYFEK